MESIMKYIIAIPCPFNFPKNHVDYLIDFDFFISDINDPDIKIFKSQKSAQHFIDTRIYDFIKSETPPIILLKS